MLAILQKTTDILLYVVNSEVYLWLFVLCMIVLCAKLLYYIMFGGR